MNLNSLNSKTKKNLKLADVQIAETNSQANSRSVQNNELGDKLEKKTAKMNMENNDTCKYKGLLYIVLNKTLCIFKSFRGLLTEL